MSWFQAKMPREGWVFDLFRRHPLALENDAQVSRTSEESPAHQQFGALPYREKNGVEVLLVTSRETRRWVIPKGWPIVKLSGVQAAAREAFEEAGVTCVETDNALGAFRYWKRLKSGDAVECEVVVFPMNVRKLHNDWPEKRQRERRWFGLADAAAAVDEEELREIILQFGRERGAKVC